MPRNTNEKTKDQVPPDTGLALLWLGRLAERGDTSAQATSPPACRLATDFRPRSLKPRSGIGGLLHRTAMPTHR